MMKIIRLIFCVAFLLSNHIYANAFAKDDYAKDVIIVKVKPEYLHNFQNDKNVLRIFSDNISVNFQQKFPDAEIPSSKYNTRGEELVDLSTIYQINLGKESDIFSYIRKLNKLDIFEYVEPLYFQKLLYVPNDPMNNSDQYWLDNIKAYDGWNIHQGDTTIVIGIVDTGIDISHEDLIYNIKYNYSDFVNGEDSDNDGYVDNFRGWDFGDNNNNPQADGNFHGSMVAGIASASTDNQVGMSGVGFKCKFLPIKVMNADGIINTAYDGLVYAANKNCKVINCSWGNTTYQQMSQDVVNYATINKDALVIGSCGNSNSEILFYPASYENVVSVAATTSSDEKWTPENTGTSSGSSYSPVVDVCAPGTLMRTTNNGDYIMTYGGTSFAAPVVSGIAGILRSYHPDKTAWQIAEMIKLGADNIDEIPANQLYAGMLGSGRVNLYKSLTLDSSPGVSFKNIDIVGDRGEGSTFYLKGNFINYLDAANSLSINISCDSEHIQLLNQTIFIGQMESLESYYTSNQIPITVKAGTPNDELIYIKLEYVDGDYRAVQNIPIVVNFSYRNIVNQKMKLSVVSNGRLGYTDVDSNIGEGLKYDIFNRLFYDGGLIIGNAPNRIVDAVRKNTDFKTIIPPTIIENGEIADNQITTSFTDENDANPFGVEIIQNIYSWDDVQSQDFMILEYNIINKSTIELNSMYFGIFHDWDLVDAADNSAVYDSEHNLMYCQNNGEQTLYASLKLLSYLPSNNYALPQNEGGDGVIDISSSFTDMEKFYTITNSNSGYGNPNIGADIVMVNSTGPFDIKRNDTVKIVFAYLVSESLFNLFEAADEVESKYSDIFHETDVDINTIESSYKLYPNPAKDNITISISNLYESDKDRNYDILNIKGDVVLSGTICKGKEQKQIDTSSLQSGVYYIKINNENHLKPIVIIRN